MSDQTKARDTVLKAIMRYRSQAAPPFSREISDALDAYAASIRSDVFAQVEAEARRRAEAIVWHGYHADGKRDAYAELADWCQSQRQG